MQTRLAKLCWLMIAALWLASPDGLADRQRRTQRRGDVAAVPMAAGPSGFDIPATPGELFGTVEVGGWAPAGGPWDDLLKAGPTASFGIGATLANFDGGTLPPSSTRVSLNYTFASMNGDEDVQVFTPSGFQGEVDELRLHFAEVGATQRFYRPLGAGSFVDIGVALGLGAAGGSIDPVTFDPTKGQYGVSEIKENGFVVRGELNGGVGWRVGPVDLKAEVVFGVSGSDALTSQWNANGDVGGRLVGTIYLP